MSDCQVVFYGELLPGQDAAVVRQKVAALFKASESQISAIFSGKRVVVKSGLPSAKAEQYRAALAKAGAVAHIEGPGASAQPAPVQSVAPVTQAAQPSQQSIAGGRKPDMPAAGKTQSSSAPKQVANTVSGESSGASGAGRDPGDDVGRAVVKQVDAAKLGQLKSATVAPVGTTLGEEAEQPEVNLDLSHISLSAVGSDLQDSYEEAPPSNIDISHLSLGD